MGQLIEGVWHEGWYDPDAKGEFIRPKTRFQVPEGTAVPAEPGRYHLYVSYACPWAHRAIITRAFRGLEGAVGMTVVDPKMGPAGWAFDEERPDPLFGAKLLSDVYLKANARYSGRVTVPVLWDKQAETIVVNESRQVMRVLDVDFESLATRGHSLAPAALRAEIDETITHNYGPINDGVYRCGFAGSQRAYESNFKRLFAALDDVEAKLGEQRFLCGSALTEADIALFTTLLRFDLVYYAHFKCNARRIQDYPNLWGFTRDVYQTPGVKETCHLDHIKTHYYWSQTTVNPSRIVPVGPYGYAEALETPHGRG